MYLALIILPILGSIVSGFFGRKVGVSGSQLITCTCVISTTFLAILAFIEVGLNNIPVRIDLFRWIDAEHLNIHWAFNFDSLTVSMLIPVLIVSSLVHVYSIGYMSHDPHNQRFFSYLSLFTFMMIILVTGDNYLVMFVGWEGVGVCSYLLVSFWFTRIAANQSSLAAFFTNRVGDCVLTIGMFAMLWSFGNVDYTTIFSLAPFYNENIILFVGICLLIGAMAKSSQVGLHVWLPMAMEGFWAFLKLHYIREHLDLSFSPLIKFMLGKIWKQRQPAGNSTLKGLSSSETTREAFKLKKDLFKFWFIGFSEGDGSFIVNKDGYLEFKVTQSYTNIKILYYIKKELGFGVVRIQDINNNTYCFRVRDKKGLFNIISIFNGNIFLSSRIKQFKLFIDAYNYIYKEKIGYDKSKLSPTLNDGWISGFTDAEGCFTCTTLKDLYAPKNTSLVRLRFILSQKYNCDEMDYLANLLKGKKYFLKSYNGYNLVVNTTSLSTIINYIKRFPLKTNKNINFYNWLKIYNIVMKKEQYTTEGFNLINRYKNNMNKLAKLNSNLDIITEAYIKSKP
jgi:proton-conducting membrane transporter/NADH-ubiquinone oxidoreductase (complex I) subunit 5/LAGLIDADG DNA endonuclease family protein